ncbi:MAG: Gfo/Idh/MocA family oxidoreductase [Pseudomonadota bacterium]
MTGPARIAVVGAGLVGRRHAALIAASPAAELAGIADPAPDLHLAPPVYDDITALIAAERPDGVIIATPNHLHAAHAEAALSAGIPALIEKPLSDRVATARRIAELSESSGIPVLVGHHRRHNPRIVRAREIIESGALGRIVAVNALFWIYKPDDYFRQDWRRQRGAGPVFINLIHDIDLLRHLCGEIASVQAIDSSAIRGFEVEDTAAALLRFRSGALGTITASDTAVAPWSWELTAGENPAYPQTDEPCYLIAGTHGALSLPTADLWHAPGARSWWEPIDVRANPVEDADPLERQLAHFIAMIREGAAPLVPASEGLRSLEVIEALKRAAAEGGTAPVGGSAA